MGDSFADAAQRVEPVEAAAAEDDQVGLFGGSYQGVDRRCLYLLSVADVREGVEIDRLAAIGGDHA